jgi:hypothetical protein
VALSPAGAFVKLNLLPNAVFIRTLLIKLGDNCKHWRSFGAASSFSKYFDQGIVDHQH